MKKLALATLFLSAAIGLQADPITLTVTGVTGTGPLLRDSGGTELGLGNAIMVGSFDTGFNIAANAGDLATLQANFGYFDDVGTFVGNNSMISGVTQQLATNTSEFNLSSAVEDAGGTQPNFYVWAFNDAVVTNATEWGIFQVSDPLANGVIPTGTTQSIDFASGISSAIVGSYAGGIGQLSPVPEPSTYAAIAGAAVLGFAIWRRRKQAA